MPEARCGTTVARIPVDRKSTASDGAALRELLGPDAAKRSSWWGATRWCRIGLSARRHGNEKPDSISSIGSDGGRSLLQTMPNFGRGQSVADACKGTRIPRARREAPNPLYLPGGGEGS